LMTVTDGKKSYKLAIVNMPSIVVAKKFSELTTYPDIAADYARTLTALKELKFDLWVSSHAAQFNMHSKRKPVDKYDPLVFSDRKGYDEALRDYQAAYDKKLQQK
jgi:metallo-beta-lactamase class B